MSKARRIINVASIVIALAIAATLTVLWWMSTGPQSLIPESSPSESNRVIHPEGFSIIVPENWNAVVLDSFGAKIKGTVSDRLPFRSGGSTIIAERLSEVEPQLGTVRSVVFQGQPAHMSLTQFHRDASFDDGESSLTQYDIYCIRDGTWYRITYSTTLKLDDMPDTVMDYLESFNVAER